MFHPDNNVMFRGNSLASKAMEAFMKVVGEDYLRDTLMGPIEAILVNKEFVEVQYL